MFGSYCLSVFSQGSAILLEHPFVRKERLASRVSNGDATAHIGITSLSRPYQHLQQRRARLEPSRAVIQNLDTGALRSTLQQQNHSRMHRRSMKFSGKVLQKKTRLKLT
jgi:hypothetical protein